MRFFFAENRIKKRYGDIATVNLDRLRRAINAN